MKTVFEVLNEHSMGVRIELPGNLTGQVWMRDFQEAKTPDEVAQSVKEIMESWEDVVEGKQAIRIPVEFETHAAQEFGRLYEFVRRDQKRPANLYKIRIIPENDLVQPEKSA